MGYIIIADVSIANEENLSGDSSKVRAQILDKRIGVTTFSIPGDFHNQKELTKKLCNTLIDAGFVSFSIRHSY